MSYAHCMYNGSVLSTNR